MNNGKKFLIGALSQCFKMTSFLDIQPTTEDRHYKIYSELQKCTKSLSMSVQQRMACNTLSDLAAHLMNNPSVFKIVSDLKEIQELNEKKWFRERQRLMTSHRELKNKMKEEQNDEMLTVKPHNLALLKKKHEKDTEQLETRLQTELDDKDKKVLQEIDNLVVRQQTTLLSLGVPGFSMSGQHDEIRKQMAILQLIEDVRHMVPID